MAYIDNTLVTIDAIITERGRELLSKGRGKFKVSKFAVADDGVDYRLWDSSNTKGSVYYGQAIENMSVPEANPNQDQTMNFKMLNLPKNVGNAPTINLSGGTGFNPIIQAQNWQDPQSSNDYYSAPYYITPVSRNPSNANSVLGYTLTLSDREVLEIYPMGNNASGGNQGSHPWNGGQAIGDFIEDETTGLFTVKATGTKFRIHLSNLFLSGTGGGSASVTIEGNEIGGKLIINFTVLDRV